MRSERDLLWKDKHLSYHATPAKTSPVCFVSLLSATQGAIRLLRLQPFRQRSQGTASNGRAVFLLTTRPTTYKMRYRGGTRREKQRRLHERVPQALPTQGPPCEPYLSCISDFRVPAARPRTKAFYASYRSLPFNPSQRAARGGMPSRQQAFSKREGQGDKRPSTSNTRHTAKKRPLRSTTRESRSLFLYTPNTRTRELRQRLHRRPTRYARNGPRVVPTTHHKAYLPNEKASKSDVNARHTCLCGEGCRVRPISAYRTTRPCQMGSFLSSAGRALRATTFPTYLCRTSSSSRLTNVTLREFTIAGVPVSVLMGDYVVAKGT